MDTPKSKKKRTLVVVDGDALEEHSMYDFSFLEKDKRLEIWFFYRKPTQYSFRLRKDFSAHSVITPRYEEDTHLYLLKRVCFELGRRRERYKKVYLIGTHHPIWEGLVQFLRERDFTCVHVLASDYQLDAPHPTPLISENHAVPAQQRTSRSEETSALSTPLGPGSSARPETPKTKSKKSKRTQRDTRAIYDKVIERLKKVPSGTKLSRDSLRELLREVGLKSKKDLPGQNFRQFVERLVRRGHLMLEGDSFVIPARP